MNTLSVAYKPDDYPYWIPWQDFNQIFDLIGEPGAIDIGGIPTARAGFAPRVPLQKPGNDCDDNTGRNLRRGYLFQVKFNGTGHAVFNRFRIQAQKLIEKSRAK